MPQIFHRSANTISRASILFVVILVSGALWAFAELQRSPFYSWRGVAREQPVPFSHQHHVGGLGLDCRYCHTGVENSPVAGVPPTHTCMTCHSQLYTQTAMLAPIGESLANDAPIHWNKVNRLPDYVYFDHSIHIAKGVTCATCHRDVNSLPLMRQGGRLAGG